MLKLRDFFHLPQIDPLIERLIQAEAGLSLVAGLELRPAPSAPARGSFLPSGRATVFWILMEEILASHPQAKCKVIVEDKDSVRIDRGFKKRVEVLVAGPPYSYAGQVGAAASGRPDLLVIDRLTEETVRPAFRAAQNGLRVLTQVDTVFRGGAVARQLVDLGAEPESLDALDWILTVQRMPALCPSCKQPTTPGPEQLARLRRLYPGLEELLREEITYYRAGSCPSCQESGRQGDLAVFDLFKAGSGPGPVFEQPSLFPMEAYILRLATSGRLPLEDFTNFETDQFRRTFQLLADREAALRATNSALEGRLVELEAAHRVLQRRTNALISIQDIGQALISGEDLYDLASRVCRRTCELCGANRAILYYRQSEGLAEVLAASGWDPALLRPQLTAGEVFSSELFTGPVPFSGLPPGIAPRRPEPEPVRAGMYMPLVAQERQVGLMIVQSTQKARFEPGEMALLRTFAQQAALALQRAGLIEQLRAKIGQLEAAHLELGRRERLAREMELARQVQQSVLPTEFPVVPGYRFAAQNEPARRVGGDFYDIFSLDDRRLGLAIADVSDKGIPAALYMALTRSLLRAEARRELSPAAVVANVNRLLIELGEAKNFVTLFYAVLDLPAQRLSYTRAGHDRPVLLRNEMTLELSGEGVALGLLDEKDFFLTEEEVQLQPGDRLVLYTDGLCDILNGQAAPFGRDGFKSLLVKLAAQTAAGLCASIFDHLRNYRGEAEQYDDMTLLVVEVQ